MYATSARERAVSATASLAIIACGAAALVIGLAPDSPIRRNVEQTLTAFTPERETPPTKRPAPPPPPAPTDRKTDKAESSRARDAASPRNLRNQATAIFAPVLPPLRSPPAVIAAPKPALGSASNSGASDVIGPGQGAGGIGNGAGGNGDGGDGDGDSVTRPIQISGKLRWSDLPRDLRQSHRGGELELVYRVSIDGRVSNCRVTRSSGLASLDAQTCRLITDRFRFRPSRDAAGRPVPANIIEVHGWDPAPDDVIDDGYD